MTDGGRCSCCFKCLSRQIVVRGSTEKRKTTLQIIRDNQIDKDLNLTSYLPIVAELERVRKVQWRGEGQKSERERERFVIARNHNKTKQYVVKVNSDTTPPSPRLENCTQHFTANT